MPAPARWMPALLLGLPALLAWVTYAHVNLTPKVDQRFFFAPESPIYRESRELERQFHSQETLVVTAYANDIGTPAYRRRIAALTERLGRLEPVIGVRSLANGPDDLDDARDSPLWRRLLLFEKVEASNLVLVVDDTDPRRLVEAVSAVLREMERPGFRLQLVGIPYVVYAIADNLERDFRAFNLAAVGVFAVVMLALFRSWAILLGSLTACATAALATLLIQQVLGGRIGLLTANLVTISFVLTQSHVVFMANNWRQLQARDGKAAGVAQAVRNTGVASAWCMVVALLGFASLLYVDAQPLRELGYGGTIATISAILSAYLVFPPFLSWARPAAAARRARPVPRIPRPWAATAILAAALATGGGAVLLNTDPSLLDYFAAGSRVHRSLAAVDPHGGSSPLNVAVRRKDGARLDNGDSYDRLWRLQNALQRDPAVGTVLSLPVLMAEAERSPLSFFLSWKWLLDLLSRPEYDRAADSFITRDRTQGLFMMRMIETGRTERRTDIMARLNQTISAHGFEPALVGGIFALQGQLADQVTRSLFEGLAGLLLACAVIGLAVTRAWAAALALAACTAAIPAVTLGLFGLARVPMDIIATPAVNVAIGVAVDSMIHLGAAWRRARKSLSPRQALREARREQAPGMLAFFVVVAAGFSIFVLSSFPPTQRFGVAVVAGAAVAAAMARWVFPALLAGLGTSRRQRGESLGHP